MFWFLLILLRDSLCFAVYRACSTSERLEGARFLCETERIITTKSSSSKRAFLEVFFILFSLVIRCLLLA